jgi:hypothetical protein
MPPTPTKTCRKKKKKRTRKDSLNRSLQSEDAKRCSSTNSPSVITPPVVTHTQGDATKERVPEQLPPLSPLIIGPKTIIDQLPVPQVANKRALEELVSVCRPSVHYQHLVQHKESKKKKKVAKLI